MTEYWQKGGRKLAVSTYYSRILRQLFSQLMVYNIEYIPEEDFTSIDCYFPMGTIPRSFQNPPSRKSCFEVVS